MKKLNRYTTASVLLDMLKRKRIVLRDPSQWEDKNDSEVLAAYKRRKKLPSLFAWCLSHGDETIHHWKTFAGDLEGCCVDFDWEGLVRIFKANPNIRFGPVTYKRFKDLAPFPVAPDDMPFTKRWPYRCEEEYRVIWEGRSRVRRCEVELDLATIRRVTVSQRMPGDQYKRLREEIRGLLVEPGQNVYRSTIYRNAVWISKLRKA